MCGGWQFMNLCSMIDKELRTISPQNFVLIDVLWAVVVTAYVAFVVYFTAKYRSHLNTKLEQSGNQQNPAALVSLQIADLVSTCHTLGCAAMWKLCLDSLSQTNDTRVDVMW